MEDNSLYRDLFFEETDTYLGALNDDVLLLEENPEDIEIVNAIFRSAHTLKGMAATMGYDTLAKLTHHMENVLDLLKESKLQVTHDVISLIFDCLDTLTEIVEDLRMDGTGRTDISELVRRLNQLADPDAPGTAVNESSTSEPLVPQLSKWDASDLHVIEEASKEGYNAYVMAVRVSEESMMKSVRAFLVINELEEDGELIHSEPSVQEIEAEQFDTDFHVLYLTQKSKEAVKESILSMGEISDVVVADASSILQKEEEEKAEEETQTAKQPRRAQRQTIRVPLERLDHFMNLVSELVISRTRLENINNNYKIREIDESLERFESLTSELQDVVLQLRMQPFRVAVQRFPRMVRDLADEMKKDIKLVIEGDDTELDRTVVSELGEPLVHLLRNAVDHGIEPPEEREAKVKPRQGTVKVAAYPEGNRVVVTIEDDGKGLNPESIKESAEQKGIDTAGMTDEEIIQLIFDSGFSTKKNVTGVSGRGVGMDVVKQKINSLNGSIETISTFGKGTTFRITLPLTLSIIQSLLVKAGEQTFALPQTVIEKVEEYDESLMTTVHGTRVYSYKDQYLPIFSLSQELGVEPKEDTQPKIVIADIRNQFYAVIVDELLEQREIVIKELGEELNHLTQYLGASILGDGEVILIVDLSTICGIERGHIT